MHRITTSQQEEILFESLENLAGCLNMSPSLYMARDSSQIKHITLQLLGRHRGNVQLQGKPI